MRMVFECETSHVDLPEPDLGEVETTTPITIFKRMEDYTITTYNIPNTSSTIQMTFDLLASDAQALLSFLDSYKGHVIKYYPFLSQSTAKQGYITGNVNTIEYGSGHNSKITLKFKEITNA